MHSMGEMKNLHELTMTHIDILRRLCEPLKNLGINNFSYYRVIDNQKAIYFCTDQRWHDLHYFTEGGFAGVGRKFPTGKVLYTGDPDLQIYAPKNPMNGRCMIENNLWNAISFYESSQDLYESFNFFGQNDTPHVIDVFLNYESLLKKYISYFKVEFNKVLETIKSLNFINISIKKEASFQAFPSLANIEEFIENTPLNYFPIYDLQKNLTLLSIQQSHLIQARAKGYYLKQLEHLMGMKGNTAELYWSRIKAKTGLTDSNKLINAFIQATTDLKL